MPLLFRFLALVARRPASMAPAFASEAIFTTTTIYGIRYDSDYLWSYFAWRCCVLQ